MISLTIGDIAQVKRLPPAVIEVVVGGKVHVDIIVFTQISYALGLAYRVVLTRHMVGHEVHDYLHPRLVRPCDKPLPLLHTLIDVDSQIGVNVIIIGNGIGRTGTPLDHLGVLSR